MASYGVLVISDAVLTDERIRALPRRGTHAMIDNRDAHREAADCRAYLTRVARGEETM